MTKMVTLGSAESTNIYKVLFENIEEFYYIVRSYP